MATFIFPDSRDRLVYSGGTRFGSALTSAQGVELYIYLSPNGDLAPITTLDDEPIEGSKVVIGPGSLIPQFKGPDGVEALYYSSPMNPLAFMVLHPEPIGPYPVIDGGGADDPVEDGPAIDGGNA